jgi:hypothetical protein
MSIAGRCVLRRDILAGCCAAAWAGIALLTGCGGGAVAPPQSNAQERVAKVMNLIRAYVDKTQKAPPNEQALRDFAAKLTPEERSGYMIGDDLENIFTSPRDNKKFLVKYNLKPEPAVTRALVWEETGQDGMHWVALTNGYTVEYDDQQLKDYIK